ncbi:MAG: phage holin family protein [Clostridia bacterium]
MAGILLRFLVTAAAVPLCGYLMDGVAVVEYGNAIVVGLVLAVIYTALRPVMRLILSVINFCTLGLVNIAVDAWLVWTAADFVKNSVLFENFWWALAVALAINVARTLVDAITGGLKR